MAQVLIYFPQFGPHAYQLITWLTLDKQGVTIAGVIFGYIVLSAPQKSLEN